MVKRTDLHGLRAMAVVPAACSVEIKLTKSQVRMLRHAEQIRLYGDFASTDTIKTSGTAGLAFESLAQSMPQRRAALKLVPVQSGPRAQERKPLTRVRLFSLPGGPC